MTTKIENVPATALDLASKEIEQLKAELQKQNAETQFARAKADQLQKTLKAYAAIEENLVPLPNGDLHRGFKANNPLANIDVEVIPERFGNPLDRAVSKALKAATGGEPLTCLWCGFQFGIPGPSNAGPNSPEHQLRDHLVKSHPSIVEGYDKVLPELLHASLQEANARLAAVEAKG